MTVLRIADHASVTDTGRQRRANEDSSYARPPLFVVADGMGGAQAGEVASRTAVEVFSDGLPDEGGSVEERLARLVAAANTRIHELAISDADRAGMGTTLTAAYLDEEALAVAHVGDSRLYCFREGTLEQRTDDHSLVGELVRRGQLSPEEAEEHPQRSIITRALGPEGEVAVDHHTWPARDGDVFLLCSDGLTTMIGDGHIAQILTETPDLKVAARALVRAANDAGGRDNITVVLFRVQEIGGPAQATQAHAVVPAAGPAADETMVAAPGSAVADALRAEPPQPAETPVVPRTPRAPGESRPQAKPERGRSGRRRRFLKGSLIVGVVTAIIVFPAYSAVQSVYFVGVDDDGMVTLYKGVPYDLPGGVELYSSQFTSGVPVGTMPAPAQKTVRAHKLRTFEDARDLVRQIERGDLAGQ